MDRSSYDENKEHMKKLAVRMRCILYAIAQLAQELGESFRARIPKHITWMVISA